MNGTRTVKVKCDDVETVKNGWIIDSSKVIHVLLCCDCIHTVLYCTIHMYTCTISKRQLNRTLYQSVSFGAGPLEHGGEGTSALLTGQSHLYELLADGTVSARKHLTSAV